MKIAAGEIRRYWRRAKTFVGWSICETARRDAARRSVCRAVIGERELALMQLAPNKSPSELNFGQTKEAPKLVNELVSAGICYLKIQSLLLADRGEGPEWKLIEPGFR